jgi:uncharacterized membrane protein YeaQ/YmgE (transglycosylase-associated protein family)
MNEMGLLSSIIVGAIAGWLASMVMSTNRQQGLLMDIVVGIVGAFIGSFLFSLLGASGTTGFNIWSIFVAVIGAIVLLGVLRMFGGGRRTAL